MYMENVITPICKEILDYLNSDNDYVNYFFKSYLNEYYRFYNAIHWTGHIFEQYCSKTHWLDNLFVAQSKIPQICIHENPIIVIASELNRHIYDIKYSMYILKELNFPFYLTPNFIKVVNKLLELVNSYMVMEALIDRKEE